MTRFLPKIDEKPFSFFISGVGLEKRLKKGLVILWSRNKITKKAHAGRGHEIKGEMSINFYEKENHHLVVSIAARRGASPIQFHNE